MLGSGMQRARKTHRCGECGREIMRGEHYQRDRGIWEGEPFTAKFCKHCSIAAEWLSKECGGFIYGEILPDLEEHQQESNGAYPELTPIIAGMRAKWRDAEGSMLSVPTLQLGKKAEGG